MKACSALLALALLALAGCAGPKMTWQQKMDSSAGVEREQAILEAGQANNRAAIPQIINRLDDDDVAVRLAAIDALHNMTGKDFGYVAYDDEVKRRAAAAMWKAWWQSEGSRGAAGSGPLTGGKP